MIKISDVILNNNDIDNNDILKEMFIKELLTEARPRVLRYCHNLP